LGVRVWSQFQKFVHALISSTVETQLSRASDVAVALGSSTALPHMEEFGEFHIDSVSREGRTLLDHKKHLRVWSQGSPLRKTLSGRGELHVRLDSASI
jgi:hypothetical protein